MRSLQWDKSQRYTTDYDLHMFPLSGSLFFQVNCLFKDPCCIPLKEYDDTDQVTSKIDALLLLNFIILTRTCCKAFRGRFDVIMISI